MAMGPWLGKELTMSKELKSRSLEISKAAKAVGKDIHKHLVNLMVHAFENKDVSTFTHFRSLLEMKNKDGESHSIVRVKAVADWINVFGIAVYGKTKDGKDGYTLNAKMHAALAADKNEWKEHLKQAKATPWNKLSPEKPYSVFDLDKALAALVKRAEEKADETGPNGEKNKVDTARLDALKALLA